MTCKMTQCMTRNDIKCHLNVNDVHITDPKSCFLPALSADGGRQSELTSDGRTVHPKLYKHSTVHTS